MWPELALSGNAYLDCEDFYSTSVDQFAVVSKSKTSGGFYNSALSGLRCHLGVDWNHGVRQEERSRCVESGRGSPLYISDRQGKERVLDVFFMQVETL